MIDEKDKICAFFRRAWWETARNHLNENERLQLYEAVFSFQFTGEQVEQLPPMVAMLFDLIQPILQADKEKMQKRAEIARANGMAGGRPKINSILQEVTKPSGLNENPAGFYGLPIYNIQNTNTIANNNVCVQGSEINTEDTHTKFLVTKEFFLMGVNDPVEEAKTFWAYYDARGWVTGDGQKVKNITALAKSWHPKNLTIAIAKKRQPLKSLFNLLEMPDFSLFERLLAVEIDNSTQSVFLFVRSKADAQHIEERHINALSKWVKEKDGRSDGWELLYRFQQTPE